MTHNKFAVLALVSLLIICAIANDAYAQGPKGKDFGFGIILGDPLGGTIKYWTSRENAFDAYIGSSYFGSLRVGGDYLWHFDAFHSQVVKMYAGPGIALGFGRGHGIWFKEDKKKFYYWDEGSVGIAGRVIVGLNIIPKRTPIEIFLEFGPLIGLAPNFGVNVDAALGIRFYP